MFDKWNDDLRIALKRPLPVSAVQWKPGPTNQDKTRCLVFAYIDARTVMERLDRAVGPGNWTDHYEPVYLGEHGGIKCSLTVLGVTKEGIGDDSATGGNPGNELKAAFSDALKRAAVHFGIGRYLYALGQHWVPCHVQGKRLVLDDRPELPSWAIPDGDEAGEELSYKEPEAPEGDVPLKPREATSTPAGPQHSAAPAKANATTNPGEYVLQYGKKHNGKTLAAIYAEDKDYLAFITGDSCTHPPKPAIIAAIKTYGEWLRGKQGKDTEHSKISLSPETMKALLDGNYAQAAPHAAAMVNLSKVLTNASTTSDVLAWANIYRGKREEGKDKEEAAAEADKFILEGLAL